MQKKLKKTVLQRKVIILLAECFQVPVKTIGLRTKLAELHAASTTLYGFVNFTFAVEKAFCIALTDDQARLLSGRATSVKSACASLRRLLPGKNDSIVTADLFKNIYDRVL
ncbi:MAG: hypothetical protein PHC61_02690 [Chitinivibrionales bacterium]|nr:hypothetical protein [Chitinivibrionales bacterium]